MPSDHAYKMDYRKMLAFHDKSKADITIGVVAVPIEEAHRFGTLTLGENGYVTEYIEKPDIPRSNLVSMGIYIFNKDVLIKRIMRMQSSLPQCMISVSRLFPGWWGEIEYTGINTMISGAILALSMLIIIRAWS